VTKAKTVAEIRLEIEGASDRALRRLAKDQRTGVRELALRELRRRAASQAEAERLASMLAYESELWRQGVRLIAGIDEVGCGPLAGPLVAAAVILPVDCSIAGVDDSKKLDAATRARLDRVIRERAVAFAIASCSAAEVDELNVYHAACEAMRRAVVALRLAPEHLLVDARRVPDVIMPQTAIITGDALSQSIAAASILAKVERDSRMDRLAEEYPGYGFEKHKGYGTAEHLAALERLGCCREHRRSYAPVATALGLRPRQAQLPLFGE
jgi:ribonuclease HII